MAKNYTAEQVADMIMNDDIGEMDSADSLDEESSSSSSNNEPSSQPEVDSSSNTDHGRTIRTRGGISNRSRTVRIRGGISNRGKRTVRTEGRVQNCPELRLTIIPGQKTILL